MISCIESVLVNIYKEVLGCGMDEESQLKLVKMIRTQRVAALGTLRDGGPLVSMVVYVVAPDFEYFYIHASRLAQHTQDFLVDPLVSLLINEPDCEAKDPHLLARVSIRGDIEMVPRTAQEYEGAKFLYLARYPKALAMFQLGDFALYRIRLHKARYVAGFGKTYNLLPEDFRLASFVEGD